MSYDGSIILNNSTHIYILFLAKTMSLLTHSLGLTAWRNPTFQQTNKLLFSKILSQKGWALPMTHSLLSALYTYHHWRYKKQIQPIINAYISIKMKLTNYSNNIKNFQIDISTKYLMTKKLFVMWRLVTIMIHNRNLP